MTSRLPLICALFLFAMTPALWSQDLQVGDPEVRVYEVLGMPKGTMKFKETSKKILDFDRGQVIIENGKVKKLELLPGGKTAKDISASSQKALEERQKFEAAMKEKQLENALSASIDLKELEKLPPDQREAKIKEFKANNPGAGDLDKIEAMEKKIEEERKKAEEEKKKAEKDAPPKPPEPPAPAKPSGAPPAMPATNAPAQGNKSSLM